MANPYNNGQVTWNANDINAARDWFSAGKSATDTQARANELGLSNTQLENLWNVSMGPNGGTNPFTRSTTATQAPATIATQGAGASHPDLTQTVYNTPNGVTDGANPFNWNSAYSSFDARNAGMGSNRVAAAGNMVISRDPSSGALSMSAIDQSGNELGNRANFSPDSIARMLAGTGLYQDPNYRANMSSLASQLDAAGINYRPGQMYQGTGSNHGVDLVALANGGLGAQYDWTSDALAGNKGPTAISSLQDNQRAAAILGITGANSGLLGQSVPRYNAAALGDQAGGIQSVALPNGAVAGQGTGTMSDADRQAFIRSLGYRNYTDAGLPQNASGGAQQNNTYGTGQPGTYNDVAAEAAARLPSQPTGSGGMLSQSVNMGNGQWNVTPDQLVENRLQNLLDDDNPLVQMARTQGLQDAQSRGLLNSSLGAQAGALAAYQYAMPVAQQDATTYGNAARTNAENAVQMQMQQAGFGHDADMARINEGVQSRLSAQGAQQELARLNQAHRNTLSQTSVQQQNWMQQSYLSQMNNYQNSLAQYTQRIQEADMPADQKTAQINELMQTYSNLINWSNASYGQMPQWVSQWSTLAPTIESR